MDDLTYGLKQLCRRNRDGSHATQGDRMHSLTLIAAELKEMGFKSMLTKSLRRKHVEALLDRWKAKGLSAGTLKNRLAHLRWWAEKVGKRGELPSDNTQLGVPRRVFVTNVSKARELGDVLTKVRDPHLRVSLQLQAEFGLRREEALKFQPRYADCGDHIRLKSSWAKGGKYRELPVRTAEQRRVLGEAHKVAGAGSLIPPQLKYIDQRNNYDGACQAAGLDKAHGLRHAYAQRRYQEITGWPCPACGGPSRIMMTPVDRAVDKAARLQISEELGHERLDVVAVYLGG